MIPHIYGLANDMDKILKIAKKYKLYVIEDAAEALGLKYKKKQIVNCEIPQRSKLKYEA